MITASLLKNTVILKADLFTYSHLLYGTSTILAATNATAACLKARAFKDVSGGEVKMLFFGAGMTWLFLLFLWGTEKELVFVTLFSLYALVNGAVCFKILTDISKYEQTPTTRLRINWLKLAVMGTILYFSTRILLENSRYLSNMPTQELVSQFLVSLIFFSLSCTFFPQRWLDLWSQYLQIIRLRKLLVKLQRYSPKLPLMSWWQRLTKPTSYIYSLTIYICDARIDLAYYVQENPFDQQAQALHSALQHPSLTPNSSYHKLVATFCQISSTL